MLNEFLKILVDSHCTFMLNLHLNMLSITSFLEHLSSILTVIIYEVGRMDLVMLFYTGEEIELQDIQMIFLSTQLGPSHVLFL